MTYMYYVCSKCNFYVRVTGCIDELDDLARKEYSCPECDVRLEVNGKRLPGRTFVVLTKSQFISAINGMGLPSETVTHVEPIVAMLKSSRVVDVKAFERDGRCFIHEISLDNGVTLHLAASGYGAVVYKATRGKHANHRSGKHDHE